MLNTAALNANAPPTLFAVAFTCACVGAFVIATLDAVDSFVLAVAGLAFVCAGLVAAVTGALVNDAGALVDDAEGGAINGPSGSAITQFVDDVQSQCAGVQLGYDAFSSHTSLPTCVHASSYASPHAHVFIVSVGPLCTGNVAPVPLMAMSAHV